MRSCPPLIWTNIKFTKNKNKSPFQEQLTKVATWWADIEVMGQVVTEPGTRVREVWNGSRLQGKEHLIPTVVFYTIVHVYLYRCMLGLNRFGLKSYYLIFIQKAKWGLNVSLSNLCVDQFHQLVQQLFSSNPGIEHGSYIFSIRLKGPWWGTQVAKEVCDHISQGWFTKIAFAIIIKSGFLKKITKHEKLNKRNPGNLKTIE